MEETALEKQKSIAEQKFIALTAEAKEMANRFNSIVIENASQLSSANQLASEGNKLLKLADGKRLEILKPAKDFTDTVNALVKGSIIKPLEAGIAIYKEKVAKWNKKETDRKTLVEATNKKIYDYLISIKATLDIQLAKCDTVEKCEKLVVNINAQFPKAEVFIPYAKEAMEAKAAFIKILTEKKWAIESGKPVLIEQLEKLNAIAEAIEVKSEVLESTNVAVKSNTRKVWKWRVTERTHVPYDFLIVDEAKVRKYMSEKKSEDGTIVPLQGFEFYQEDTIVIR